MQIIKRIKEWQSERKLDEQEFVWSNEAVNIFEEILEALGYEVPKEKRSELKIEISRFVFALAKEGIIKSEDKDGIIADMVIRKESKSEKKENACDAFCDIINFSVGAILKLGYDPTCALNEMLKEVESRTGKIVDGKFQKDTSKKAKAKWYKADYKKCKRFE